VSTSVTTELTDLVTTSSCKLFYYRHYIWAVTDNTGVEHRLRKGGMGSSEWDIARSNRRHKMHCTPAIGANGSHGSALAWEAWERVTDHYPGVIGTRDGSVHMLLG
jgi:hypothetical protein